MGMKTISGIEFASEHNGTDVFRLIELAYEQGQKDVIEQLPSAQPEIIRCKDCKHWIPVTKQPPEVGKRVMICDAYGDICIGHRTTGGYYFPDFCDDKIKDVRAWAELPEPYREETE